MAARPDLVLVMTDQQRHDQVGATGDGYFVTPNLDRLAASGVLFENAYSGSTTCVPSRGALLTGMHPTRLPSTLNLQALPEGFWTVARALRDSGQATALVDKMHQRPIHTDHGFDTMRMCEAISVLAQRGRTRPLFLIVSYIPPARAVQPSPPMGQPFRSRRNRHADHWSRGQRGSPR